MCEKTMNCLFKLMYSDPRPYLLNENITPLVCSKEFGNPSGHSSASAMISIVLILDIFHGSPLKSDSKGQPIIQYKNYIIYIISLIIAIYWAVSIPFSRYLLGVHSLD